MGDAMVHTIPDEDGRGETLGPSAPRRPPACGAIFSRLVPELIVSVEPVGNLVVVRTVPGTAQYVASAIDFSLCDVNLGTIAGDDTLLVVARDGGQAAEFVVSARETLVRDPRG